MDKLKDCPFCGDKAWMHTGSVSFGLGFRVECEGNCHAMTCYWHTEEQAIEHWNMRNEQSVLVESDLLKGQVAEMKADIKSAVAAMKIGNLPTFLIYSKYLEQDDEDI